MPVRIVFNSRHEDGWGDRYECDVILPDGVEHKIWYSIPSGFFAHNDSVATALTALCNKKFDEIYFNFPVSEKCRLAIERRNACKVTAPGTIDARVPGERCGLAFSGGFDSLAAWLLSPDDYIRVGMDWLTGFERERDWLQKMQPEALIQTNVRELGYNRIDNRFMGSGVALYADYLGLGELAFGTIMEGGPHQLRVTTPQTHPPQWLAAGVVDATPTRGVNQVSTGVIIAHFRPDLLEGSLASLARPGQEKYLRKSLILGCAMNRVHGTPIDTSKYVIPRVKTRYGKSYAFDFITLFFMKKFGREFVSRWADGLDHVTDDDLAAIDEEFFHKRNPLFDGQMSPRFRDRAIARMTEAGIGVYEGKDWDTLDRVRDILAPFHPVK